MAAPNNFYWKQYEGEAQAALVALAHDDGKGGSLKELPQAVRHAFRLAITSEGNNGKQFLEVSQYDPAYLLDICEGTPIYHHERPLLMYREEWRESSAGGEDAEEACASCGKTGADLKRCTACKRVWYCDVTCQRNHRKTHRDECKRIEKGGAFVGRTDDDNVLSRLLIAATMAMLEGGRLLAEQSPGVSIASLSSMPAHFFQPRQPGLLLVSAELLPWLERIKERLGDPLNFIVAKKRENNYGDHLYLNGRVFGDCDMSQVAASKFQRRSCVQPETPGEMIRTQSLRTALRPLAFSFIQHSAFKKNGWYEIMGKKGKRAGKTGGDATAGGKAAAKTKQGPGKARRERAAALREIQARLDALISKLEEELRDVELFGPPEEREECPICFVPLPLEPSEISHVPCCGKMTCAACVMAAMAADEVGQYTCAFCRAQVVGIGDEAKDQALRNRVKLRNRVESGDAWAMFTLAEDYELGVSGVQKDHVSAMKLWLQSAELGHIPALCAIAKSQLNNEFEVRTTKEQALKLAKAAATKGSAKGHAILGFLENKQGDLDKALKHFVHAAIGGDKRSFDMLRSLQHKGLPLLNQDELDDIEPKHKEALALEWSEERERYRAKYI